MTTPFARTPSTRRTTASTSSASGASSTSRRQARRVRRPLPREAEPRAPLLALVRPGAGAVLRPVGHAVAGRRQRHAGGVLGRDHLVRLLGRRRAGARAVLLLVHRAGARRSDRAAARVSAGAAWVSWPTGSLALLPYEAVRTAPTRPRRYSSSSRARTKPARCRRLGPRGAGNARPARSDDPDRPVAALDAARVAARVGEARLEEHDLLAVELRDRSAHARHAEREVPRAHLVVDRASRLRPVDAGVVVIGEVPCPAAPSSGCGSPGSPAATRSRARGRISTPAARSRGPNSAMSTSSSSIGTVVCASRLPVSSSASIRCQVEPHSASPSRSAQASGIGPRWRGSSAGCMVDRAETRHVEGRLRDLPRESPSTSAGRARRRARAARSRACRGRTAGRRPAARSRP